MDHIDDMDQLRQGIGLQAYGQRDPLVEYKMSGYEMFDAMTSMHPGGHRPYCCSTSSVEQKVEREEVAKVTGTNKDETASEAPKKRASGQDIPERSVPVRKRKEIQAVLRPQGVKNSANLPDVVIKKILIWL